MFTLTFSLSFSFSFSLPPKWTRSSGVIKFSLAKVGRERTFIWCVPTATSCKPLHIGFSKIVIDFRLNVFGKEAEIEEESKIKKKKINTNNNTKANEHIAIVLLSFRSFGKCCLAKTYSDVKHYIDSENDVQRAAVDFNFWFFAFVFWFFPRMQHFMKPLSMQKSFQTVRCICCVVVFLLHFRFDQRH